LFGFSPGKDFLINPTGLLLVHAKKDAEVSEKFLGAGKVLQVLVNYLITTVLDSIKADCSRSKWVFFGCGKSVIYF
jgi:hypothetical protein